MKKANLILAFIAISIIVISCAKDGATGATGPAGSTGAVGPIGPGGPAGPAGTANVIYSDWFNFKTSDYKDTTLFHIKLNAIRANKAAPSLTAAHLSSAVILSYMAYKPQIAGGLYAQLPWIFDENDYNVQLNYIPLAGKLVYYWMGDGGYDPSFWGTDPNDYFGDELLPADVYFRYVIIPGGTKTSSNVGNTGFSLAELKNMSNEQIQRVLKIPATGSNID